jgi:hypothetical protein
MLHELRSSSINRPGPRWVANDDQQCYWIKQLATVDELDRAIKIIHTQELGCHRYSGRAPQYYKDLQPNVTIFVRT